MRRGVAGDRDGVSPPRAPGCAVSLAAAMGGPLGICVLCIRAWLSGGRYFSSRYSEVGGAVLGAVDTVLAFGAGATAAAGLTWLSLTSADGPYNGGRAAARVLTWAALALLAYLALVSNLR
jgi:hypothetical protein